MVIVSANRNGDKGCEQVSKSWTCLPKAELL